MATGSLVLGLGSYATPAAQADGIDRYKNPNIVAMGDSYGSGEGTGVYLDAADPCHRSNFSWESETELFNGRRASASSGFKFMACSGAKTTDIAGGKARGRSWPNQMSALNANTDVVFLSLGGNDANFSDVLKGCAALEEASTRVSCLSHFGGFFGLGGRQALKPLVSALPEHIDQVVYPRLQGAIGRIVERAPNARIIWAGYPDLVGDPKLQRICSGGGLLNTIFNLNLASGLRGWFRARNLQLNAVIKKVVAEQRALGKDVTYVSTFEAFNGHDVCKSDPRIRWINPIQAGLGGVKPESMHPNAAGHDAYRRAGTTAAAKVMSRTFTNPANGHRYGMSGAILARYLQIGANQSSIGVPIMPMKAVSGGYYQRTSSGGIWYSSGRSAALKTGIAAKYVALGMQASALGWPISEELRAPVRSMSGTFPYVRFQNGNIYWSPSTGTHSVAGPAFKAYAYYGGSTAELGLPTSDSSCNSAGACQPQTFQHGVVRTRDANHYVAAKGRMGDFWLANRNLGLPVTDQIRTTNPPGIAQEFANASVFCADNAPCYGEGE